jgi:cyclophilin family peptidyl-prolyl cis-trans isomerase/FKBP-type peptidyl-prolyl cis-trans isomerase
MMRRAWVAAAAAAIALAACGGDDSSTDEPAERPAEEPAEEPADEPAEQPADEPAEPTDEMPARSGESTPADPETGKPAVQLPAASPTELVVFDVVEGSGRAAEVGDTVVLDYVGVLSDDGTEFDNSYDRGAPIDVTIGTTGLIDGFTQGLIGVQTGTVRQVDIPSSLAYGDAGAGDVIPPGAAISFVIEVRSVEAPPPPPTLAPQADPSDCPAVDGSSEQLQEFDEYPPTCIDVTQSYTAEIVTNFGSITVELDPTKAPLAVNSFVTLARYHYFDGTECHRAIPGFVVQCGDPTATGTGGPGYRFPDELPAAGEYAVGSLAMANSGPDTNGSQFFIITGEDGAALPPQYTLFGEVVEGLDTTLPALDAVANPESNGVPPLEQILIDSVTITES